jgi:hypothetical protein
MFNQKKAPGLNLITARMLKELPNEGLVNLMYILNAILRLEYWPKSLKIAQIIMVNNLGNIQWTFHPTDQSAYYRQFQKH